MTEGALEASTTALAPHVPSRATVASINGASTSRDFPPYGKLARSAK